MTGCKEVENGIKQKPYWRQGDYLGGCCRRLDKAWWWLKLGWKQQKRKMDGLCDLEQVV